MTTDTRKAVALIALALVLATGGAVYAAAGCCGGATTETSLKAPAEAPAKTCPANCTKPCCTEKGFVSLFDGKTFDGWKVSTENPKTFTIADGAIVAKGNRAHLFYAGKVGGAKFKNFELKIDCKTLKNSNGGIYFHTAYQKSGWPSKGFEVQVNNTHKDRKKSGGLYGVKDVMDKSPAVDGVWFTQHIIVKGKTITIKVTPAPGKPAKTTVEWTEPTPPSRNLGGRVLSSGTIGLQGHDPKSTIYYKNIRIKPLPDDAK